MAWSFAKLYAFVKLVRWELQCGWVDLKSGRSGGIRTHDPYTPSVVRYRAALRSDLKKAIWYNGFAGKLKKEQKNNIGTLWQRWLL